MCLSRSKLLPVSRGHVFLLNTVASQSVRHQLLGETAQSFCRSGPLPFGVVRHVLTTCSHEYPAYTVKRPLYQISANSSPPG
ncbi:hypothetical protein DAEQUDRAFT_171430 [Daedalea quercina L-15889]|uniref:Uncharacterized protein n=1 Tax=Daedalea quercina L-15889 TaxID=1314783 RepID=A0A165RKP2_9APHY|nr:hypothetical protein DAEQUDRAFT_171430 [Daedalea quercina L-15889]